MEVTSLRHDQPQVSDAPGFQNKSLEARLRFEHKGKRLPERSAAGTLSTSLCPAQRIVCCAQRHDIRPLLSFVGLDLAGDCVKRGNLAHSCLLNASFTGASIDSVRLGVSHPHLSQPQAPKVPFSSHTNVLAMIGIFCHTWYRIVHCGHYLRSGQDLLGCPSPELDRPDHIDFSMS